MALLSSSLDERAKIAARAAVADGRTQLVIGTHALIQDRVVFKDLGLVVIDEQHKFGVEQRGLLYGKGTHAGCAGDDGHAHSAHPGHDPVRRPGCDDHPRAAPRTAGHCDPGDRGDAARQGLWTSSAAQVAKGRQAFLVYPLVEESEQLEIKAATEMFQQLQADGLLRSRDGAAAWADAGR
jgi:ATP-dependent DNA helicase RecG